LVKDFRYKALSPVVELPVGSPQSRISSQSGASGIIKYYLGVNESSKEKVNVDIVNQTIYFRLSV